MTDYATIPAGPELDRLVAEKVMGWHSEKYESYDGVGKYPTLSYLWFDGSGAKHYDVGGFRPSNNLLHAWRVVERLRALITVTQTPDMQLEFWNECPPTFCIGYVNSGGDMCPHARSEGDTPSVAICRTALLYMHLQTLAI